MHSWRDLGRLLLKLGPVRGWGRQNSTLKCCRKLVMNRANHRDFQIGFRERSKMNIGKSLKEKKLTKFVMLALSCSVDRKMQPQALPCKGNRIII